MSLTIEQYVKQSYFLRSKANSDRNSLSRQNIEMLHAEIADRMKFSIPLHFINSYNINSCIVPLSSNSDYYHIIDLAMFDYMSEFLNSIELDVPNYACFFYRNLRSDICRSNNDSARALLYDPPIMFINKHDADCNSYSKLNMEKYQCMIRFYFLHEYMHYLIANPIKDSVYQIADDVVEETLLPHLWNKDNSKFPKEMKPLQYALYKKFHHTWYKDTNFREEVYCDFQAIQCLMEYGQTINIETIFDSIMSFLYIQHIIWLAKHSWEPLELGNKFAFRQNILAAFALLLEDENYSEIISKLYQQSNRYYIPTKLQMKPLNWEKQGEFYNQFCQMLRADRSQTISNGSYVFPAFSQPKYELSAEYMKMRDIPPWYATPGRNPVP